MYCTDSILHNEDKQVAEFGVQMINQLKLLGRIDQVDVVDDRRQATPMKEQPRDTPRTARANTTNRKGAMDAENVPQPK